MIRVLVVDDHLLFRDGLTGLLGTVDYIDVVGSVVTGSQLCGGPWCSVRTS